MDHKERQRKKALIVLQIVIYGYLLLMFGIQLYMSFARGWWELHASPRMVKVSVKGTKSNTSHWR